MKGAAFLTSTLLLPVMVSTRPLLKPPEKPLQFTVTQGPNQNWFFKNRTVAVQLLVTSGEKSRVIAAFPSQNSGIGIWFAEKTELKLLHPKATGDADSESVSFSIQSDQPRLTLKRIELDNVRILRNAPPAGKAREAYAKAHGVSAAGTAVPKTSLSESPGETILVFERRDFKASGSYRAELHFPRGTKVEKTAKGWVFSNPHGKISMKAKLTVPYKAMPTFYLDDLFSPRYQRALHAHNNPLLKQALLNVGFLAYKEKFLAGGWQYLTYFGRDTAFTLFMLNKILSRPAYETGLQSLLDRVSEGGEVAHEEDLGSLSQVEELERGMHLARHPKASYDYNMVDETFLLPIAFAQYLEKIPQPQAKLFLQRVNQRGESNLQTLLRNFQCVIEQSKPFAQSRLPKNLIRIRPGTTSGNWRDSRQGLAFGKYPGDVNCWLVPEALESIARAAREFPVEIHGANSIQKTLPSWQEAERLFEVKLSPAEVREKVKAYLEKGPFAPAERSYFLSQEIEQGITIGDFLNGKTPSILKNGLEFPALSLDENGKPIPILHSDPVFELFFHSLSREKLEKMLPIFSLPYPIGLRTPVGLLCANPAYASPSLWKELNADAYHGTVAWVWAQSMLRLGLSRQMEHFRRDPALFTRLQQLQNEYEATEKDLGPLALSELYTWEVRDGKLTAAPYGARLQSQTESDAVQLWSSVLPILEAAKL